MNKSRKYPLLLISFLVIALSGCNNTTKTTEKVEEVVIDKKLSTEKPINTNQNINKVAIESSPEIKKIQQLYQEIEAQLVRKEMREDVKTYNCQGNKGSGELKRYYRDNKLLYLQNAYKRENRWEEINIYFKKGSPFFIFEKSGSSEEIEKVDGKKPNRIETIKEKRYYIEDGNVLQHLEKEYKSNTPETEIKTIPNTIIKSKSNNEYPKAAAIPQMEIGNVGC
ncbi:hypothetical protein NBT05_17850 [Aquimarina sp. ERC-38]|uniref:hypothetical protein n=1 Tax=Aquimarina sp. ERC-38 TaxID=2949996 RepID=UPI002246246E|nr:hypothetical protein [Aquimarina sp. ERC-38]UZO80789.1 hypothetical protein NBT05_17850 [Aquimarina sp. ERC-38]